MTFCSRFLAESDKRGVAFTAFSSALRTNSSAVAPSKTGIFFIVMAIIVNFIQMYYFIVTQQNSMQIFVVSTAWAVASFGKIAWNPAAYHNPMSVTEN